MPTRLLFTEQWRDADTSEVLSKLYNRVNIPGDNEKADNKDTAFAYGLIT